MSKLRDQRGMTLTELLCTIIVMLMVSALMAVGVGFSVRTYRSSMQRSEAQVLASTLTTAISDKLRYCGSVSSTGDKIFIQAARPRGIGGQRRYLNGVDTGGSPPTQRKGGAAELSYRQLGGRDGARQHTRGRI